MKFATGLALAFACSTALATEPVQRTLSFEDRVNAQAAIERVYYSHQLGATTTFDEAIPKSVLEGQVHRYLEQSAALSDYWKTEVTDYSLQRELERMAQGTRMPERLTELYAALGNDPFLIKECLARPALVDRLIHNFYAFDPTMHVKARGQADALHRKVVSGELSPSADNPNRTISELVMSATESVSAPAGPSSQHRLTPTEYQKRREELPALQGQISEIEETRDAYLFCVILSETTTSVRIASYVVPKATFDEWWEPARRTVRGDLVTAVAINRHAIPVPSGSLLANSPGDPLVIGSLPYPISESWDNGILGAVTPRSEHTAVWTGNLMIVWGGSGGSTVRNTGARYDPATDSWSMASSINAPPERSSHTAVWTGSVMIVWGGDQDRTGGRYDPVSDHWTRTSTVGAPSARYSNGAVWSGRFMIVWGGYEFSTSARVNTGGRYDPATDTWMPMSTTNAPSGRSRSGAPVWTGSLMLVWGGTDYSTDFNTGGRYDPESDTWTSMSTIGAPTARYGHTAVWTGSSMVVWGGQAGTTFFSTGGRYDPNTDHWMSTSTTGAPPARQFHTAVWTGNLMIVWGGGTNSAPSFGDGGRYNPTTDSWTYISTFGAPSGRVLHTAVWTGNLMVVWGGSSYLDLSTGGRYDPATFSWTPTATSGAPTPRYSHAAVWTGSVMVVWGGFSPLPDTALNTGGRYNPAIDNWAPTATAGAPSARLSHTGSWTGNRMMVWGGCDINFFALDTGGSYDPVSDQWTPTSASGAPGARYSHTAVWTGSQVLIWGGASGSGELNSGGRYNPATNGWAPMSTAGAPSPRLYHTAVWTGSLMLVWGGEGYSPFSAGGRYDPASNAWSPMSVVGSPPQLESHTAVWTGSRMVIWGGLYASPVVDTGARYDPATDTWTPTSTTDAPSARATHTAVWTGRVMIVWGGEFDSTGGLYDPQIDKWTATTTEGAPTARGWHTALWTGSQMLVWGGIEGDHGLDTGGRYNFQLLESCNGIDDDGDGVADNGGNALCDDGNPCTDNFCQGIAGCVFVSNSGDCDDGSACTTNDACVNGTCIGGPQLACDDLNSCTTDTCNPASGCVFTNDANICNDHNPCTDDSCVPPTGGCVHVSNDSNACSDDNLCTQTDECHGGTCSGSDPVECSGACPPGFSPVGELCRRTYDIDSSLLDNLGYWCDGTGTNRYNNCNSLNYGFHWTDLGNTFAAITRVDVQFESGLNCGGPSSTSLTLNGAPAGTFTLVGTCGCTSVHGTISLPSLDVGAYALASLNSISIANVGNCGGLSRGQTLGDNFARITVTYLPPDPACRINACNPVTGACGFSTAPDGTGCSDDDACTTGDTCGNGVCAGTPLDCNDNHPCTEDSCDPESGCEHAPAPYGADCDDQNACNGVDSCDGYGACVSSNPPQCDDHALCTEDSCDPLVGCVYRPYPVGTSCSDGNACNGVELCDGNSDCISGIAPNCADNNPCTTDSCNAATGCVFSNNTNPCSDGNACTTGDVCGGGSCHGATLTCNDNNPCTTDSCNAATGCAFTNNTNACSDGNACTAGDVCGGGSCHGAAPLTCNDNNPCTTDTCNATTGCVFANNTNTCNDGNACTTNDACGAGSCHGGAPLTCNDGNACNGVETCNPTSGCIAGAPLTCADTNPCTTDTCNAASGCVFTNNANACNDGNACTTGDVCGGGSCHGATLTCNDNNPCTTDSCNSATGCVFTNNTNVCNDGNACTRTDVCSNGACVGGNPVVCGASDQCHTAGVCATATGVCSNTILPNGTVCDDASLCTTGETCQSGTCTPARSGLDHPRPRSSGYYRLLCERREHDHHWYQGDQLTDADAVCVGQLTSTFAGITTVDDICDVMDTDRRPPHGGRHHGGPGDGPNGRDCDKGENELIATALNVCRARVCEEQGLDSHCHGNSHTTVSQSFADADAILDDPARDRYTCKSATCELREINNGHALEMNSLMLSMDNHKVRLTWSSPVLDDGSGAPASYELWRRPMGSDDAFVKIGTTTGLTFVDVTGGTTTWEYDITAVIPGDL